MAQPLGLTERAPVACSGCYGQYPERAHVDFRSAIEGGQIDPSTPRSPHVNWVVLCENCIRNAYELLPEQDGKRELLAEEAETLRAKLSEARAYSSRLEDALAHRPSAESPEPGEPSRAAPKARARKPRYAAAS
jgi:hypothetical protein